MENKYRSIIVHGEDVISISALLKDDQLGFTDKSVVNQLGSTFSPEMQIKHFEENAYDVYVDKKEDTVRIISAIPKNSPINHQQWMATCADYLKADD